MPFIDKPWPVSPFIVFPLLSLAVSVFAGRQVISRSDDWYRARDEKQMGWVQRNPRLSLCLMRLAIGIFVSGLVWKVVDHFLSRP